MLGTGARSTRGSRARTPRDVGAERHRARGGSQCNNAVPSWVGGHARAREFRTRSFLNPRARACPPTQLGT
eukprot:11207668-Lingulodinium_polyedra.AAC.1